MSEYRSMAPAASTVPRLPGLAAPAPRRLALMVVTAGAYYAAAQLGYALHFAGPVAAIVWLPVGVGIACLYLCGLGLWPGVVAGDLLANDYSALPIGSAVGQTFGNLLEVVVAALLLRRLVRRGSPLDSASGVVGMLLAIVAGTAVSATVGNLSLLLGNVIAWSSAFTVWRTWWLGDFCGALLVIPLVLAWHGPARPARHTGGVVEGVAMLMAVAAAGELRFASDEPFVYLVFPALVWAALRFGQRGATVALLVAVSIAIWNTTHSVGPFHFQSINQSILAVQLYILVAALSTLFLAAVVTEREAIAARLGVTQAQAFEAAQAERHRIERNLHGGVQNHLLALRLRVHDASERSATPAEAGALLRRVETELDSVSDELRSFAQGLHPLVLRRLGLAEAIKSLAAGSQVPVTPLELPAAPLHASVEEMTYLTIAEAITNARKYARASSIRAGVRVNGEDLCVEVVDDGVGGAREGRGSGLLGLRELIEAVGGSFLVESTLGHGTRIAATIPIASPPLSSVAG